MCGVAMGSAQGPGPIYTTATSFFDFVGVHNCHRGKPGASRFLTLGPLCRLVHNDVAILTTRSGLR